MIPRYDQVATQTTQSVPTFNTRTLRSYAYDPAMSDQSVRCTTANLVATRHPSQMLTIPPSVDRLDGQAAILELLVRGVMAVMFAPTSRNCVASLRAFATGNGTVPPSVPANASSCAPSCYVPNVVSERRTRHSAPRLVQTTGIGHGMTVSGKVTPRMTDESMTNDLAADRSNTKNVLPRAHTTSTSADGRGGPGGYECTIHGSPPFVKSLSSGPANANLLIHALPSARLRKYRQGDTDDPERALELYVWNEEVSSAFHRVLGPFEVTLRNSIDRCLANAYGPSWFADPNVGLDRGARSKVDKVLHSLHKRRNPLEPLEVIEALPLGFWVRLLSRGGPMGSGRPKADYERTIWRPAVRNAFPHRGRLMRSEVHDSVRPLHELRNRVAHYEPICHLDLAREHQRILEVTGWMCPRMSEWISQRTQVPTLLKQRPDPA